MLEIKNLKKSFKNKDVLKGVSFSVNEGEIVCLLGNNGAGKTTIINCILKMMKPDQGIIEWNGKDIAKLKNRIYFSEVGALLETSINIYDYLTGMQNIEYFAGLMNLDKGCLEKASKYIKQFKLQSDIHKAAGNYSRGMQQKLALIIALMASPKLLLLDEPTLGLDIESKLAVIEILKTVVQEEKIAVILTTHQMEVVQKLSGKIILLKDGKVITLDSVENQIENSVYTISYIEKDQVKQVTVEGKFQDIYQRYSSKDIVEIKKNEKDIEKIILEVLSEAN